MAIISFYEVDFSFDLPYLQKAIKESENILKELIKRHLTDKTLSRVEDVFSFFGGTDLLENAFKKDSPYYEITGKIVADMNKAMDNGDL